MTTVWAASGGGAEQADQHRSWPGTGRSRTDRRRRSASRYAGSPRTRDGRGRVSEKTGSAESRDRNGHSQPPPGTASQQTMVLVSTDTGDAQLRHAEAAIDEEIVRKDRHADGEHGDDCHHARPAGRRDEIAQRGEGEEGRYRPAGPRAAGRWAMRTGAGVVADMRQQKHEGQDARGAGQREDEREPGGPGARPSTPWPDRPRRRHGRQPPPRRSAPPCPAAWARSSYWRRDPRQRARPRRAARPSHCRRRPSPSGRGRRSRSAKRGRDLRPLLRSRLHGPPAGLSLRPS